MFFKLKHFDEARTNFITNIVPPKNINNLKTNKKVQRKEKFHSECILSKIEVGRRLKKIFQNKIKYFRKHYFEIN
jgi:hypothetical protein